MPITVVEVWRVDAAVEGAQLRAETGVAAAHTNVAHTRGCSLLVAGDVRVGVDVERVRTRPYVDQLARRAMHDHELARWRAASDRDRAFLQHWTRVEAYLKALGVGVRGGLRTRPDGTWTVLDLALGADHVGAVAIEAPRPVAVVWRPVRRSGGTSG